MTSIIKIQPVFRFVRNLRSCGKAVGPIAIEQAEQTLALVVWLLERELAMRNDARDRLIRSLAAQLGAEAIHRAYVYPGFSARSQPGVLAGA